MNQGGGTVDTVVDAHLALHPLPLLRSLRRVGAIAASMVASGAVDFVYREFFWTSDLSTDVGQLYWINVGSMLFTWILAWSFMTLERRKPFGSTSMRYVWIAFYYGAGGLFMLRLAFAGSNNLYDVISQTLRDTRFESLTTSLRIIAAIVNATVLIVLLVALPRALARLQLDGRITGRAADDCVWFAAIIWTFGALAGLAINVIWEPDSFYRPVSDIAAVTGFVFTRVALSRPRPERAPSLVIVLLEDRNSRALRNFINLFSGRWLLGPITLMAPASNAIDYYGAHARVAARVNCLETLFPKTVGDLNYARKELPRDEEWKGVAVRECYPAPSLWTDYFRSLLTPSTWVLLVAESHDLVTIGDASRRLDAIRASLPISRTYALTGEEVPATLQGLSIVRIAAVGRDSFKRAANRLQQHIGRHEGKSMPQEPDWPAFYLGAPLAWNGLGVCALFALGALLNHGFNHRATTTMIVAVLVAINHCIAAAVAILPKRYLSFARRTFWSGRPKGAYALSGLATFIILLALSAMIYPIRVHFGNAPMTPFFSQAKWLLLSVTLTVTLASLCDDYVLQPADPPWLRPLESVSLACVMAIAGWLVINWVMPDIVRVRPNIPVRSWTPVLVSAGIGALFGYTWPAWYRRNLRARTQKTQTAAPEEHTKPSFKTSSEPPTIV
ncbi:hypothetical protein M3I54_00260 [Paraburkholderia sp. CNPSo 3274]|uniref:hypothetical protein n=1 Tax=Paraburkholderia sp. CNPSo 3274 TaxID=2940932 RepID=UPI0020B6795A|nr:hypothetical protein [Paraburkholderia sp. CNPSo 3274]MCP3705437.1 hypothetical protein [Paraburkholderia sp. CNPSo 3274]